MKIDYFMCKDPLKRNFQRVFGCRDFCTASVVKLSYKIKTQKDGGTKMKGYFVADGYMGYVGNTYILFASESEYWEYMKD